MAVSQNVALGALAALVPPSDMSVYEVRLIGTAAWTYSFTAAGAQVPVEASAERQIPLQVRASTGLNDGTNLFVAGSGTLSVTYYGQPKS
jgi:uncharacterized membrane protein YgdD (TMEM256/DUF423 family)